jgi:hypothetical protein
LPTSKTCRRDDGWTIIQTGGLQLNSKPDTKSCSAGPVRAAAGGVVRPGQGLRATCCSTPHHAPWPLTIDSAMVRWDLSNSARHSPCGAWQVTHRSHCCSHRAACNHGHSGVEQAWAPACSGRLGAHSTCTAAGPSCMWRGGVRWGGVEAPTPQSDPTRHNLSDQQGLPACFCPLRLCVLSRGLTSATPRAGSLAATHRKHGEQRGDQSNGL